MSNDHDTNLARSQWLGIMGLVCFGLQLLLPLQVSDGGGAAYGWQVLYSQVLSPFLAPLFRDPRGLCWLLADGLVIFVAWRLARKRIPMGRKSVVGVVVGIITSIIVQLSMPELVRLSWGAAVKYLGFAWVLYGAVMRSKLPASLFPTTRSFSVAPPEFRRARALAIGALVAYFIQLACPVYQLAPNEQMYFGVSILFMQAIGPLAMEESAASYLVWLVADALFMFVVIRAIRGVAKWPSVWLWIVLIATFASTFVPWSIPEIEGQRFGAVVRYASFILAVASVWWYVFAPGRMASTRRD